MTIQTYLVPTVGRQIDAAGSFFRYESADPAAINPAVRLRVDGNDLGPFLPGDSIELPFSASRWEVVPTDAPATVRVGFGRITTNRSSLVGSVAASIAANKAAQSSAFANAPKTVTTTSGQLLAPNAARQYLLIQNNSTTGTLYLNFGAGAATLGNGMRIIPGGYWEWTEMIPVIAVQAISDIPSNANILVVEG